MVRSGRFFTFLNDDYIGIVKSMVQKNHRARFANAVGELDFSSEYNSLIFVNIELVQINFACIFANANPYPRFLK